MAILETMIANVTMTLTVFLSGIVVGFLFAVMTLVQLLSPTPRKFDDGAVECNAPIQTPLFQEAHPSDASCKLLEDAVKDLINVQQGRDAEPHTKELPDAAAPSHSLYQLEQIFEGFCSFSKDRAKQLKSLSSFMSDIGRAHTVFSKDLMKISFHVKLNIKTFDQSQALPRKAGLDAVCTTDDIAGNMDDWWKALTLCMSQLSDDNEKLSETLSGDVSVQVIQISDDLVTDEKKLITEGTRLLNQLKDSIIKNEHLTQDRDRWRLKLPASAPSTSKGVGMPLVLDAKALKLQASELALDENMKLVQQYKKEFRTQMPKLHKALKSASFKFMSKMKMQLMRVADVLKSSSSSVDSATQRLRSQISATCSTPGAEQKVLMGFESMLQQSLEAIMTDEVAVCTNKCQTADTDKDIHADIHTDEQSSLVNATKKTHHSHLIDMSLESTACLAATSPHVLPVLPTSFSNSIGEESCVWFNAFSGRIYRDAARSEYFHSWLLSKLTSQLNKGTKPGFMDDVVVESVSFGATPPLLYNVKWSPPVSIRRVDGQHNAKISRAEHRDRNVSVEGAAQGRRGSGGKDMNNQHSDSKVHDTHSSPGTGMVSTDSEHAAKPSRPTSPDDGEVSSPAPTVSCAAHASSSSSDGTRTEGAGRGTIDSGIIEDAVKSTDINEDKDKGSKEDNEENSSRSKRERERERRSEDIECTAEMAFRAGLKFKITTRLWCNWPRDRYASIPVTLILELLEVTGRVRFGVTHSSSFFSFLQDPQTRFAVHTEVGGDSFKFKDVPKLSDYIVKKLKEIILRKLVHPNSQSFRLIWPRSWWPTDVQAEFSSKKSTSPSPPPTATPTATATVACPATAAPATTTGSPPLVPFPGRAPPLLSPQAAPTEHVPTRVHTGTSSISRSDSNRGTDIEAPLPSPVVPENISATHSHAQETATATAEESRAVSVPLPVTAGISSIAAAAALASISSTTGWIREEVRRRGQPSPAHSSAPSPAPSIPIVTPKPSHPKSIDSSPPHAPHSKLTAEENEGIFPAVNVTHIEERKSPPAAVSSEVLDHANSLMVGIKNVTEGAQRETNNQAEEEGENTTYEGTERDRQKSKLKEKERDNDKEKEKGKEKEKESTVGEYNWRTALEYANKNNVLPTFLQRKLNPAPQPSVQKLQGVHSHRVESVGGDKEGRPSASTRADVLPLSHSTNISDTHTGDGRAPNTTSTSTSSLSPQTSNPFIPLHHTGSSTHARESESVQSRLEIEGGTVDPVYPAALVCSKIVHSVQPIIYPSGLQANFDHGNDDDTNDGDGKNDDHGSGDYTDASCPNDLSAASLSSDAALEVAVSASSTASPICDVEGSSSHHGGFQESSHEKSHNDNDCKSGSDVTRESSESATTTAPPIKALQPEPMAVTETAAVAVSALIATSHTEPQKPNAPTGSNSVRCSHVEERSRTTIAKEKEKDRVPDKSEWMHRIEEAKEKLQNKFSVFKSKLTVPSLLSPGDLSVTTHTDSHPTDNTHHKHMDVRRDKAVPPNHNPNPNSSGTQRGSIFKSSLPELIISSLSSLTSPVSASSSPSTNRMVPRGGNTPPANRSYSVAEARSRSGRESLMLRSMDTFSPPPPTLTSTPSSSSSPISRPRSISDTSRAHVHPQKAEDISVRSRRANSVGTLDAPIRFHIPILIRGRGAYAMSGAKSNSRTSNSSNICKIRHMSSMTPQERRYKMYREIQFKSEMEEEVMARTGFRTPASLYNPDLLQPFDPLCSDFSLSAAEMSPNAAVLAYEMQLTGAERNESSFSPGDHRAPAPTRLGVLWMPPCEDPMWAEISQGRKSDKATLQLYFIGGKSAIGGSNDDIKKSVSFSDESDPVPTHSSSSSSNISGERGGTTGSSNFNNFSITVSSSSSSSNGTHAACSKMVLAASYDLGGAECRMLPLASDEFRSGLSSSTTNQGIKNTATMAPEARPPSHGFQILFRQDKGKWTSFLCGSEEMCDDWIDAVDNVAIL